MLPTLPPLPPRDPRGHKGTFGTVAIVGGNCETPRRMIGAPALTALAALRSGAGLARLVMPAPILDAALTICPSAIGWSIPVDHEGCIIPHESARVIDEIAASADCLAIGPGLGESEGSRAAALRAVQQEACPVIVDADAINRLAEISELARDFHAAAILTPHPGEYRRIAASLNIDIDPSDPATRPAAAEQLAQRIGCIVVLKGAGTIVSDGQRTWQSTAANAALATAGTGDVLTGIIAALVAQFVPRPGPSTPGRALTLFDAACLGVTAHANAADLWTARCHATAGLLAPELADCLPEALDQLRTRNELRT